MQELEVNAQGGKGSRMNARFDLIDGRAMRRLAEVLYEGSLRYGDTNWRLVTPCEHLNHLEGHIADYKAGLTGEDHLGHILCRAMMLVAVVMQDG